MRRASLSLLLLLCLSFVVLLSRPAAGATKVLPVSMFVEVVQAPIIVNDIVYDWKRDRLLTSVGGDQGALGNSIVSIAYNDGTLEPVFIGSGPNLLALSSDANFLFVALDGAAAVRRLDLRTMEADPPLPLGTTQNCGFLLVEDMVVLANDPQAVAISRRSQGCQPSWDGVAIFDSGVMRPVTTDPMTLHNQIEPSSDPNVLFSLNTETSGAKFNRLAVTPDGVTIAASVLNPFGCADFVQAGGEFYSSCGTVVDEATMVPLGKFEPNLTSYGFLVVAPHPEAGHVFFISEAHPYYHSLIHVYDRQTFRLIASARLNYTFSSYGPDHPVKLIHAGLNRLALLTEFGQVYWLNYDMLENSAYLPTILQGLWTPGQE